MGSPKEVTQTTKTEPWKEAKPYFIDLYKKAQEAFAATNKQVFPGDLYAGPTDVQKNLADYMTKGGGMNAGVDPTKQLAADVTSGDINKHGRGAVLRGMSDARTIKAVGKNMLGHATEVATQGRQLAGPQYAGWMNRMGMDMASDPITKSLSTQAQKTLRGDYLNPNSNPFLKASVDRATGAVSRDYTRNVLPNLGSAAIRSGAYGGSRQGIMEGLAAGEYAREASDAAQNIYAQNYQSERDRMINGGAALSGEHRARIGTGADLVNTAGGLKATGAGLMSNAAGIKGNAAGVMGAGSNLDMGAAQFQNALNQFRTTGPALFNQANDLNRQYMQTVNTGGTQQQQWNQAKLDEAYKKWGMQQQSPWTGIPELLSTLTGGNFQTSISKGPNPNYTSPLQAGAGILSSVFGMIPFL
jgi:hypothetical protein